MQPVSADSCVVRRGSGATAPPARSLRRLLVALAFVGVLAPATASADMVASAASPNANGHKRPPSAKHKRKHAKHAKHAKHRHARVMLFGHSRLEPARG